MKSFSSVKTIDVYLWSCLSPILYYLHLPTLLLFSWKAFMTFFFLHNLLHCRLMQSQISCNFSLRLVHSMFILLWESQVLYSFDIDKCYYRLQLSAALFLATCTSFNMSFKEYIHSKRFPIFIWKFFHISWPLTFSLGKELQS